MPGIVSARVYSGGARSTERRNSARCAILGTAEVVTSDQSQFNAHVRNVSFAGCYLAARHTLSAKDKLILRLNLGGGISMQLKGTVSRTEHFGFGVQFDPPSFC